MHVMIHAYRAIRILIVPLRLEYEVVCELRIPPQRTDTLDDVAEIKVIGLLPDDDLLTKKAGTACRKARINNFVEFANVRILKSKAFSNLRDMLRRKVAGQNERYVRCQSQEAR